MEKIYYENVYIKKFIAEIIGINEEDGRFHIELDKTAFFPGGGGQSCDLGLIENHKVLEVYEKDGVIYHVTETKPIKIHRVKCEIDWRRRLDGMQQHLGQHVLSGCFFELFNVNTVSIHLGHDISTVDIKGMVTEDQIKKVEKMANDIIASNYVVKSFVPKKSELKKMKLRRDLPKTKEEIRVLEIEDLDINACCGVHPNNTLELQVIKIKKWTKHKDNTRIEFLAGSRAVEDYFKKDEFSKEICRFLTANEEEAINGIKNLSNSMKALVDENRSIREELSKYKIMEMIQQGEDIKDLKVIRKIFENEDVKYINRLSTRICEDDNMICIFAVKQEDRANLVFTSSKNIKDISMNDLLKDSITLVDGKGGGSKNLAQGAGKNIANLEVALDYGVKKIKEVY